MKLRPKLSLDEYFKFLDDYFSLFDMKKVVRKLIKGNNFKL